MKATACFCDPTIFDASVAQLIRTLKQGSRAHSVIIQYSSVESLLPKARIWPAKITLTLLFPSLTNFLDLTFIKLFCSTIVKITLNAFVFCDSEVGLCLCSWVFTFFSL